jgi:SWIM zinc finger
LNFTEPQIIAMAPDDASLKAGRSLAHRGAWLSSGSNDMALWGEIKGSGSKPYQTQVDIINLAFKCSCPSRKFPCKHGIGLLLLAATDANAIAPHLSAPEWVADWLDKRNSKIDKSTEVTSVNERSPEAIAALEKGKLKRANDRRNQVDAGVEELQLWLKDIAKNGLLSLRNKDYPYFSRAAARMVDAKASGLANWIKTLANTDFSGNSWHKPTLAHIAKLYLLINAYKNLDHLDPALQTNILNLIGWNQSPKELVENADALTVKDHWLVIGHEEETIDDIVVQRYWLLGLHSTQTALILNFVTRFSPIEMTIFAGTVIQAELAFFPSAIPLRAVIKNQTAVHNVLPSMPVFTCSNFTQALETVATHLQSFPFFNDHIVIIDGLTLIDWNDNMYVHDNTGHIIKVNDEMSEEKIWNWMALCIEGPLTTAGIIRDNTFCGLGIFDKNKYFLI